MLRELSAFYAPWRPSMCDLSPISTSYTPWKRQSVFLKLCIYQFLPDPHEAQFIAKKFSFFLYSKNFKMKCSLGST